MKLILSSLLFASSLMYSHAAELLTPNLESGTFPGDVPRSAVFKQIAWDEEGSDGELVKTALNKRRNVSSLFDGELIGDGESAVWGSWAGGKSGIFTLELKRPMLIERLDIWSNERAPAQGIGRVTISLSRDGKSYREVLKKDCAIVDDGEAKENKLPLCRKFELERPAVARFVKVRIEKNPNRYQMVLAECALWGSEIDEDDEARWSIENALPVPRPIATPIGAGALRLDWGDFAGGDDVQGFRVYCISKIATKLSDVKRVQIATLPGKERSYVFYPVNSAKTHYFAITAIRGDGEDARINSVEWKPVDPLKCDTFGEMLGINNYWGGGGANEGKINDHYYEIVLDMLRDSPFKRIRWWINPETIVKKYYQRGIEVTGASGNDVEAAIRLGVKLHGHVNEPHLQSITPEQLVKGEREAKAKFLAMAGKGAATHRFYGPEIGLDNASFEYLHRYLAAGGADNVDILDFHTYIGGTAEFEPPKGYEKGSPEVLVERVAKLKKILQQYKVDKPLMCSEYGYSDVTVSNPHVKNMTPAKKAAYLVRGSILHYVCGFKRLFLYSFYDEGTDPVNSEHHFGIITRDLQKKPAYYALCTMGKVLGDANHVEPMPGTANVRDGVFGYNFAMKGKASKVGVIWDGSQNRIGVFSTTPGEVTVVAMSGETRRISTNKNGEFSLRFGGEPVYIESDGDVRLKSSRSVTSDNMSSDNQQTITVSPIADVVISSEGKEAQIAFKLSNRSSQNVDLTLTLRDGSGKKVQKRNTRLEAKSSRDEIFALPKSNSIVDLYSIDVDYIANGESMRQTARQFVRRLSSSSATIACEKVQVAGDKHGYVRLFNDKLEILFSPDYGGAIIDLYDKRTGKNQLNVDYSAIKNLSAIDFAYGLWDKITVAREDKNIPKAVLSRRTSFKWHAIDGGVAFEESMNDLRITKKWILQDNILCCRLEVVNGSSSNAKIQWYLHLEWTPGGSADSYNDYVAAPLEDGDFKLTYWSGLGERRLGKMKNDCLRIVDPQNNYEISQKHDIASFENPRLWFGIGTINVEMTLKELAVMKDSEAMAQITWHFLQ